MNQKPEITHHASPIGIIDSGVGGLSVFNEIRKILPSENILYVADSAWCPYGPRSSEEIQYRVFAITDYLIEQGCSLIVIACNSATISAIEALRATYPIPFVGMEPAVKPAATITSTGIIGVMATEASIAGEKFHILIRDHAHASGVKVITRPCPHFVELVERGELSGTKALRIVEEETLPLIEAGADTLVLGCTHYPFLRPLIQQVAGPHIKIIDTGVAVARRVATTLKTLPTDSITVPSHLSLPSNTIISTGSLKHLQSIYPLLSPNSPAELRHFSF